MKNLWKRMQTFSLLPALLVGVMLLAACQANRPGDLETLVAREAKKVALRGKNLKNPVADDAQSIETGREHFQHHCQICHGMDGRNTGVPFAGKMSPPVADLSSKDVQGYSGGQLKVIIERGIRFIGMPSFHEILEENQLGHNVRFIHHLSPPGNAR